MPSEQSLHIRISDSIGEVTALLLVPEKAKALYVFAHGAGAGCTHPFMHTVSNNLAELHIATLRYNFPYMEKKKRAVDPPTISLKTVQAVVNKAKEIAGALPVFAGGKSFGGRMTSTAASRSLLPDVQGLVFFGFPLHAIGKPSDERAAHLYEVKIPMLFLQGTKDKLADITLMQSVCAKLGKKATLHQIANADHSFKISGNAAANASLFKEICFTTAKWMNGRNK